MIKTLKFISIVIGAAISLSAVFGVQSASAQGEKWELIDKTTIKVSGGLFFGNTYFDNRTATNPKSITLKPRDGDGTTNPSIWIATTSFYLSSSTGNLIERRANDPKPREKGQFCVEIPSAINLVRSRETVTAYPVHREDCQKNGNDIRLITPAPAADLPQCAVGGLFGGKWNCNALWGNGSTDKADVGLNGNIKIAYAIPGDPLKCGDPGFNGPCVLPYDPRTADCNRTNGQPGERQKCEAIKECIVDASKTQVECEGAWTGCVTSYPADNINYNSCSTAISKGDLEGGRYVDRTAPEDTETCKVDHIGWIICPVMDFMAKVVDGAYSVIDTLLTTPNINTDPNDPANGMYKAWEIMRTIANAAFVVSFLIIIFSQLTSVGITNYGIKKMLPRLVVAAILVNISYFLCAVAVDVSNILGSSTKQLFDSVGGQLAGPAFEGTKWQTGSGLGWAGITAAILAGSIALLYAQLSILIPALIAALVAVVTVFLVLTLRQALIIMLIVVSPLAFVAFLLPNTEDLFTKWRKLFVTLLLMFPIIAGIFGASALASKVVMASDTASFAVQVMGALVAIIPLFITPIVMKTAGGVLNRFGGVINNPNKGPFDRMRKGAEGYRNNRKEFRNLKALNKDGHVMPGLRYGARRKSEREAVLNGRKANLNRANAEYISERSESSDRFRGKLAQGGGKGAEDRALAAALNVKLKLSGEEIENEVNQIIEKTNPDELKVKAKAMFIAATESGDTIKALAAQKVLTTKMGAPGVQIYQDSIAEIESGGKGSKDVITELKRSSGALALKGKDNASAVWGYSGQTMAQIRADKGTYSSLNSVELASQNLKSLDNARGNITPDQARALLANDNATQALDENKRIFFTSLRDGLAYTRTTKP